MSDHINGLLAVQRRHVTMEASRTGAHAPCISNCCPGCSLPGRRCSYYGHVIVFIDDLSSCRNWRGSLRMTSTHHENFVCLVLIVM